MHAATRPLTGDGIPTALTIPPAAAPLSVPPAFGGMRCQADEDRLAALARCGLMDTGCEETFDRLARVARIHFRTPMALVSLVDLDRQFFKSGIGLPAPYSESRQTPLTHSYCRHVVETRVPLAIDDARSDPRHSGNLAIRDLGIVAYLGHPIRCAEGVVIGSFCVADSEPRLWSPEDMDVLRDLAGAVETEITLRAEVRRRTAIEQSLEARQAQVRLALDAAGNVGIWDWHVPSGVITMDRAFAALYGLDPEAAEKGLPLEAFLDRIPEEDRATTAAHVEAALRDGGAYALDHRVMRQDGTMLWVQSRAHCTRGKDGRPLRFTGIISDVTALHDAVERQEEVARELGHRVKNVMAMTQSLVVQTLRSSPDMTTATRGVIERMQALSRAHDLLVLRRGEEGDLLELAGTVAETFGRDRFEVAGAPLALTAKLTLAFSMGLHELATNAVKYGALSVSGGLVRLSWTCADGVIALTWDETGGPAVEPPTRQGLGTRLLQRVLASQIEGTADTEYRPHGVCCRIAGRVY